MNRVQNICTEIKPNYAPLDSCSMKIIFNYQYQFDSKIFEQTIKSVKIHNLFMYI